MNKNKVNLIGKRFGKLVVLRDSSSGNWECICDCGNTRLAGTNRLTSGHVSSCGCIQPKGLRKKKHGMCDTRIYNIWKGLKKRCYNPNDNNFKYYGALGIRVFNLWINDFTIFYAWSITNGYSDELELDRINRDGNYAPSNCRWVTHAENLRNRRGWKLSPEILARRSRN